MKIVACYDNGGETIDRYTVYFDLYADYRGNLSCLGMSEFPDHPQGISMWSSGMTGEHNGARIGFDGLPAHIKIHVHERVTASDGDNPPDVLKKEDNNIYLPSVTDYEARRRHRQDNALYYAGLVLF